MSATTVEEIRKDETSEDKKSELLLDSLEIKGYRCFEHLTIEKLGRVNLIVGKNNVGKTALLEALWIYSRRGFFEFIFDNLSVRNEMVMSHSSDDDPNELNERVNNLKNLFYGRPDINGHKLSASIGTVKKNSSNLTMSLEWHNKKSFQSRDEEGITEDDIRNEKKYSSNGLTLFFVRTVFGKSNFSNPINTFRDVFWNWEKLVESDLLKCQFVETKGIKFNSENKLWDNVVLTPLEDRLIESLKIIQPNIQRIAFTNQKRGFMGSDTVFAVASFSNSKERVSLKSLGEGMSRMLRIAMTLVNSQDGILLIDEIESGLHYSVLLDIWRLIFKTARDLHVQVFATTHSSDCIKAFQRAAEEDKEDEGMLIRLVRKGDKIKAVLFDEGEMETVVENNIEVR